MINRIVRYFFTILCLTITFFFFFHFSAYSKETDIGLEESKKAVAEAIKKIDEFKDSYKEFKKPIDVKTEFDELQKSLDNLINRLSQDSDFIANLRDFKTQYELYAEEEERAAKNAENAIDRNKHKRRAQKMIEGKKRIEEKISQTEEMREGLSGQKITMANLEDEILQNLKYLKMKEMEMSINETFDTITNAINSVGTMINEYGEEQVNQLPQ